jgi:hypothetical protein
MRSQVGADMKSDFEFLERDVELQQKLAEEALEEARKLSDKIANADGETKVVLQDLKGTLLRLSDGLLANATTTSVSSIAFLSKLAQKNY